MRVIIRHKLRSKVLNELHQGHCGIVRMKALARSYVWWSALDNDIASMVKGCAECQSVQHLPAKVPVHPWVSPTAYWERIHVDCLGPLLGKLFL